jgi:hypothetical protein
MSVATSTRSRGRMQAAHRSRAQPEHHVYDTPTLERYGTLREVTQHKKKKRHLEDECPMVTHLSLGLNHWYEHEEDDDEHCMSG